MRLIDADALWERLNDEPWYDNADRDEIALPIVCAAPTVDAEVVVRCKDCKYSRPLNKNEKERFVDGVMMCTNPWVSEYGITDVWGAHFCSYGERKGGEVE